MILPEKVIYEQSLYGGGSPTHNVGNPIHTSSELNSVHIMLVV